MPKPLHLFLFFIPLLAVCAGCLCDPEHFAVPDLFHPGHISEQREQMERFDPFARSDAGPAVEGDRPNGCLKPAPAPKHLKKIQEYQK